MVAIVAVGICGRCHERRRLVAHGAICAECVAAVAADSEPS